MPLAYNGCASSLVVSGTPVYRPRGQFIHKGVWSFGPTQKLVFEVEFAALISVGSEGKPIDANQAEEHILGFVLLNDWSARDIQRSEGAPLGPFNSNNFATTISPCVVTLDALEGFRTEALAPDSSPSFCTSAR